MDEQKFIAISESEYNSLKHGEYERKIKELEGKIKKLEMEKIQIAKAKAIRFETRYIAMFNDTSSIVSLYSDEDFENEILNDIKNTEFKHLTDSTFSIGFDKDKDFIIVGDTKYYKNELCEEMKKEIRSLAYEIKSLEEKKDKLKFEVEILEEKSECKDDESLIKAIVKRFSKK